MQIVGNYLIGSLPEWEAILRLVLALFAGYFIGVERETHRKPAGIRTYGLVCLGSCLFTLLSFLGPTLDPKRIAAAIITGVGFLGAGTIWKYGTRVRGLTTAAGLWVAAAIGMTFGYGYYLLATVPIILTILSFYGVGLLEERVRRDIKRRRK
jgi:putative Mg2+ transporter-C (MgtC) family protein